MDWVHRTGLRAAIILIAASILHFTEAFAWDPVKQLTGKNLTNLVKDRGNNLVHQAGEFAKNPINYSLKLPRSVLADICSAPAQTYEGWLRGQADGLWRNLPENLIQAIQPYYSVNLHGIRYAEGIHTSNGDAQTFGNRIFFPQQIDFANRGNLHWMLHELEHTVQYAGAPSEASELCEYIAKAIGSGFQHDRIDMEQAADRKADYVIDIADAALNGTLDSVSPISANQLWIANETDQEVYFGLESPSIPLAGAALAPHTADVFTGNPTDSQFHIQITTDGINIDYLLPGGTNQHIMWNNNRLLDVYHE